ncbi:ATP-dependent Clp protease proteolytic subunit, partial [Candidatus Poribacteria bacterium]
EADVERDFYMTAEQAKEYGIIDHVVSSRLDIPREGSE